MPVNGESQRSRTTSRALAVTAPFRRARSIAACGSTSRLGVDVVAQQRAAHVRAHRLAIAQIDGAHASARPGSSRSSTPSTRSTTTRSLDACGSSVRELALRGELRGIAGGN